MLKLFMGSGPQNPWGGGSAGGSNKGSGENKPNQTGEKPRKSSNSGDFDEFFKQGEDLLKQIFGGGSGGGSFNKNKSSKSPKSLVTLVVLGIALLWLGSGFYKVNTDENAAVLYFGKFYSVASPGLNYHIPYPFGKAIKKSVTRVNTEEFGFASSSRRYSSRNFDAESLMLTGDENIVDIEFQVQWQVSDIKDYVFNIAAQEQTIRKSAESAMREIIARTPIADALSDGKRKIELETKELLQEILDSYKAGVRIVLVQLRRVDPPSQVIASFKDVQTAKADKEKEINEAQAYANDIVPRARGEASKMSEQAQAYEQKVISEAQGEAGRFLEVYREYRKAKRVTKKRIYLETMEEIYKDMDKVLIDKNTSKSGFIPYFPLNDMTKRGSK